VTKSFWKSTKRARTTNCGFKEREPISLPRGGAILSLSLSESGSGFKSAVRVFRSLIFARALARKFLSFLFFATRKRGFSSSRKKRARQQQRIHKKESLEVKSRKRVF